jgi:Domain of unknown function (DUF4123)
VNKLLPLRFFDEQPLVVIEPGGSPELPMLNGMSGVALQHPKLVAHDVLLPRLIDMREQPPGSQAALIEYQDDCNQRRVSSRVCAALASERPANDIARHLAKQSVRRSASGEHYWLRFWDPLVLVHLQWIWSADELKTLMAPFSQWTVFIQGQVLHLHEHAALPGLLMQSASNKHPAALVDVGILNAALRQIGWTLDEVPQLGPSLWASVRCARNDYGLHHDDDLALFASQAQRWGACFPEQTDIKAALALTTDGETRYVDALSQVRPERWASIERELDQCKLTHRENSK